MISNSVTHLRSYTNSAIADIAGNSAPILLVTPRNRRRHRADVTVPSADVTVPSADASAPSADVSAPSADVSASSDDVSASSPNADVPTSSADIVASNEECFMMFHNVLSVS